MGLTRAVVLASNGCRPWTWCIYYSIRPWQSSICFDHSIKPRIRPKYDLIQNSVCILFNQIFVQYLVWWLATMKLVYLLLGSTPTICFESVLFTSVFWQAYFLQVVFFKRALNGWRPWTWCIYCWARPWQWLQPMAMARPTIAFSHLPQFRR